MRLLFQVQAMARQYAFKSALPIASIDPTLDLADAPASPDGRFAQF
ncbi:MAG TPA: hypothetical protein VNN81_05535 [Bradyrhizobium sp.]|nr:hypothetical protein [Bradyrhizobium sp.]